METKTHQHTLVCSWELTWETRLTHPITVEPAEAWRADTHVTLQLGGFLADTLVQTRVHRASLASCDSMTQGGITYQIMMNWSNNEAAYATCQPWHVLLPVKQSFICKYFMFLLYK